MEITTTEFTKDIYETSYPPGIEKDFWNIARNKLIVNVIRKLRAPKILDIGCGRGIVTVCIQDAGYDIKGVELGIVTPINETIQIYYNTDAIDLPKNIRDEITVITLFDVIEHIEKPDEFLKNILSYYPNVNTIVTTVPARKELWSNYDENYGHFRRYTLSSIEDCMQASNCTVTYKQYFFHLLYIMLYITKLRGKRRNTILKAPSGAIALLMHKIIGWCLYIEALVLPKRLYGSSIICVAKVNNKI